MSSSRDEDSEAEHRPGGEEPFIRPFMLVGGRTPKESDNNDNDDFELSTLVRARNPAPPYADSREISIAELDILARCATSVSIAELAGLLRVPVPIVKVLVGDLRRSGCVVTTSPVLDDNERPTMEDLQRFLEGLRAL